MVDYEISPVDAAALLRENKTRLIDVREPWEFSTAHIEPSTLIPMGDVPARAHQELDPDEHLTVLCHHGQRSLNVTAWLAIRDSKTCNRSAAGSTHGRPKWIRRCRGTSGQRST